MAPAHEGLDTDDLPAVQIHYRLVGQEELLVVDGPVQLFTE